MPEQLVIHYRRSANICLWLGVVLILLSVAMVLRFGLRSPSGMLTMGFYAFPVIILVFPLMLASVVYRYRVVKGVGGRSPHLVLWLTGALLIVSGIPIVYVVFLVYWWA